MWASQQAQRFPSPHVSIPTSPTAPPLPLPAGMARGPVPSSEINAAQQAFAARRPYFHMQQGPGSQLTGSPSSVTASTPRLRVCFICFCFFLAFE